MPSKSDGIVRDNKEGNNLRRFREMRGLAHNRKKRVPLDLMIFTAGNPPGGQQ